MSKELIQGLLGRIVGYSPTLARAVGGIQPGLFLSQLMYWSDKGSESDGAIWKTQAEWEEETALTRREQETARKRLKAIGVLEERNNRLEHKIYYSINWDKLVEVVNQYVTFANGANVHSGMAQSAIGGCTNPPFVPTEITTEITPNIYHDAFEILNSIEQYVPDLQAQSKAVGYFEKKRISPDHLEQTANAMKSSIWYEKNHWCYQGVKGKKVYNDLLTTLKNWADRPQEFSAAAPPVNGKKPQAVYPKSDYRSAGRRFSVEGD